MEELLTQVQQTFKNNLIKNRKIAALQQKIAEGAATYIDSEQYAYEVGKALADAYGAHFKDILVDGKIPEDIARQILPPTLRSDYDYVTSATEQIQNSLNKKAGISLNAIVPGYDLDRQEGLIKYLIENGYITIEKSFFDSITEFSQHISDQSVKDNADFHSKVGFQPVIVRKLVGGACEFCKQRAGTWNYAELTDNEVFRRHANCRCTVEYIPSKGNKKRVW